ncbi:MAG: hypothetical protein Q9210_005051 [Variospora velana]
MHFSRRSALVLLPFLLASTAFAQNNPVDQAIDQAGDIVSNGADQVEAAASGAGANINSIGQSALSVAATNPAEAGAIASSAANQVSSVGAGAGSAVASAGGSAVTAASDAGNSATSAAGGITSSVAGEATSATVSPTEGATTPVDTAAATPAPSAGEGESAAAGLFVPGVVAFLAAAGGVAVMLA